MLLTVTIDGYLAPFRRPRLRDIVKSNLIDIKEISIDHYAYYSSIFCRDVKKSLKQIYKYQHKGNTLFLAGKSFGAYHIVNDILSEIVDVIPNYKKVQILTIDPCWPLLFNWTPNLNNRIFRIPKQLFYFSNFKMINIYLNTGNNKPIQAGCKIESNSKNIENIPLFSKLNKVDHCSILEHQLTLDFTEYSIKCVT